jgi:hypothetical protein
MDFLSRRDVTDWHAQNPVISNNRVTDPAENHQSVNEDHDKKPHVRFVFDNHQTFPQNGFVWALFEMKGNPRGNRQFIVNPMDRFSKIFDPLRTADTQIISQPTKPAFYALQTENQISEICHIMRHVSETDDLRNEDPGRHSAVQMALIR